MHVLIADGVEASRIALRERLKAEGHEVTEAMSSMEAVVASERNPPLGVDAVVLAESLPAVHGGARLGCEHGLLTLFLLGKRLPHARLFLLQEVDDPDSRRRAV